MEYILPDRANEALFQRMLLHYDHLKTMSHSYERMREDQTLDRMKDPDFRCNEERLSAQDTSFFASLVIRLRGKNLDKLFDKYLKIYQEVRSLLKTYHPESQVDVYIDTAHITVKALTYGTLHSRGELGRLKKYIRPVATDWLRRLGQGFQLHARGTFAHLAPHKGLSMGIPFYPSNPMIQMIRGEVGTRLYTAVERAELPGITLRPEADFHTLLTHSTNFRARGMKFPLHPEFISAFAQIILRVKDNYYGHLEGIGLEDFYLGNCKSDKYLIGPGAGHEIGLSSEDSL